MILPKIYYYNAYIGLDYKEFHAPIVRTIQEFYDEFKETKKIVAANKTAIEVQKKLNSDDVYAKLHQSKNEIEEMQRLLEGYKTLLDVQRAYTRSLEERIQVLEKRIK